METLAELYLNLEVDGRPHHGLALLLADLELEAHDLIDSARVAQRVADRLSVVDAGRNLHYRLALHRALYRTQQPALSCDLFESHLEIRGDVYKRRDELTRHLKQLQERFSVIGALIYLQAVMLTFEACRRVDEIIAIIESLSGIQEVDYGASSRFTRIHRQVG